MGAEASGAQNGLGLMENNVQAEVIRGHGIQKLAGL